MTDTPRIRRLTPAQLAHFDVFGFLIFPQLFRNEAPRIIDAFEQVWREHGGGHHGQPHDAKHRSTIIPFVDQSETLSGLLDDARIEEPVASILGDDFDYESSDGNFYVDDTRWHSDSYKATYRRVKLAFYLDPVTADSGCLRVIPGSHRRGDRFADALEVVLPGTGVDRTRDAWGVDGCEVPAFAIESNPGDVVLFDQGLKHSAWGGGKRRRMFTMNFHQKYREDDLDLLRRDIGGLAAFWAEKPYGDAMIRTAGPGRMVHLEQRLANGDHLPDLVAEAKRRKKEPARGGAQWELED